MAAFGHGPPLGVLFSEAKRGLCQTGSILWHKVLFACIATERDLIDALPIMQTNCIDEKNIVLFCITDLVTNYSPLLILIIANGAKHEIPTCVGHEH